MHNNSEGFRAPRPLPLIPEQGRQTQGRNDSFTPSSYGMQHHQGAEQYPLGSESNSRAPYAQSYSYETGRSGGDRSTIHSPFTPNLYQPERISLQPQAFPPVNASTNSGLSNRFYQHSDRYRSPSHSDGSQSPVPAYENSNALTWRPSPTTGLPQRARSTSTPLSDQLALTRIKIEETDDPEENTRLLHEQNNQLNALFAKPTNTLPELPNFQGNHAEIHAQLSDLKTRIHDLETEQSLAESMLYVRKDIQKLAIRYKELDPIIRNEDFKLNTIQQNIETEKKHIRKLENNNSTDPNELQNERNILYDLEKEKINQKSNLLILQTEQTALWKGTPYKWKVPHTLGNSRPENLQREVEKAEDKLNQISNQLEPLYNEKSHLNAALQVQASGNATRTRHRSGFYPRPN